MNVATKGPERTKITNITAVFSAGIVVVLLVAQLFAYEDFPSTLSTILPVGSQPLSVVVAAIVVIAELLALPYLLGMHLSKLMRMVCACVAVSISGFWLIMALTNAHAANSALLSTTLTIPGGVLPVIVTLILVTGIMTVVVNDTRFRHVGSS